MCGILWGLLCPLGAFCGLLTPRKAWVFAVLRLFSRVMNEVRGRYQGFEPKCSEKGATKIELFGLANERC